MSLQGRRLWSRRHLQEKMKNKVEGKNMGAFKTGTYPNLFAWIGKSEEETEK